MITDIIKNAKLYYGISDRMKKALEYLENNDFSKMEPGKYEIDGSNVYAMIQQYETKPIEIGKWEAHRRYIDIQYIVEGTELIGYANLKDLKAIRNYDEVKDFIHLEGKGDYITAKPGMFVVLWPEDGHMPSIAVNNPSPVKKVVVKILV